MATRPDEAPESIVLGQFSGIRNTVAEEKLGPGELSAAVNVDIDDAGQLRRRRGMQQVHTSAHHSLERIAGKQLAVRNGWLGYLEPDYTHEPLVEVGSDRLSYTAIGDDIYFSSRSVSGKIVAGTPLPWGTDNGAGQWVSPVQTPTETLGAIAGKQLTAPPLATEIEAYKGRIYLAAGPVLWATELFLPDHVDRTRNYMLFENDITMVRAVEDGLYVGTTAALLFLRGTMSEGMTQKRIIKSPVVQGSSVIVPHSKVMPAVRQGAVPEGDGPMFMTGAGICMGLDGGEVYNLTESRVVFPAAQRAAALYREDQGANSYVAVTDSVGGPSTQARIGDYVDAQIIRASQGG